MHTHPHHHHDDSSHDIKIAFFLNLGFVLIEIVGGLLTNSMAILSDALHDLGDSISLGLSWWLNRYSERGENERYSYGYRRFSLLGALLNTLILIVGSVIILMEAIPRLLEPQPAHAPGMMLLALVGIGVNGLAVYRLRGGRSLNVRAVSLHLMEDVLGWVAIFVVGAILLFADLPILDPILSILITAYVLFNVLRNMRATATLFLQGVPEDVDIRRLKEQILGFPEVRSTHHTHAWSLDGAQHVLTTHIVVDDDASKEDIVRVKCAVRELIEDTDFVHVTVEVEYEDESCSMWRPRAPLTAADGGPQTADR
ncbi:MAG TPA: cation diffusion facilitator family transporter [Candidatus Sulfomarinibacteraceae bacterium]|nr:cation diffusion facilitator family transporter [Candidatus Sulfomarinibacteraceae bacterium]